MWSFPSKSVYSLVVEIMHMCIKDIFLSKIYITFYFIYISVFLNCKWVSMARLRGRPSDFRQGSGAQPVGR